MEQEAKITVRTEGKALVMDTDAVDIELVPLGETLQRALPLVSATNTFPFESMEGPWMPVKPLAMVEIVHVSPLGAIFRRTVPSAM